jgi:cellulose synthase/poly-beta-1,6-N-acetylglucosamine synthase-like glycosyltransferase
LALDYPNLQIIAIDDRSGDQTGAIFDEYGQKNANFTVMHIAPGALPAGWLGKCNALATAAAQADGQWLLFVDSDVKVEPDSLACVLTLAVNRHYDAVSIMTRLECHGFWETVMLPLCAASVGAMTLMSLTNDDNRKSIAFANGQFFLIRRSAYDAVGGHAAVKDNIVEDVALMRKLKASGFRTRLFFGRDFASTRMHTSLRQMFNGWARIFSGISSRRPLRIILAMLFIVSGLAAYVTLAVSLAAVAPRWIATSAMHAVIVTIVLGVIYRKSGNPARCALAFPLAGPMLLAIYAFAIRACYTGTIAWRGTNYTAPTTAA